MRMYTVHCVSVRTEGGGGEAQLICPRSPKLSRYILICFRFNSTPANKATQYTHHADLILRALITTLAAEYYLPLWKP